MADFEVKFESQDCSIAVKFESQDCSIAVRFEDQCNMEAVFGEVQTVGVGGELYDGDYVATPKLATQTMPTKGKLLIDNMTIHPIPIFKTTNASGGNTVYIAKET